MPSSFSIRARCAVAQSVELQLVVSGHPLQVRDAIDLPEGAEMVFCFGKTDRKLPLVFFAIQEEGRRFAIAVFSHEQHLAVRREYKVADRARKLSIRLEYERLRSPAATPKIVDAVEVAIGDTTVALAFGTPRRHNESRCVCTHCQFWYLAFYVNHAAVLVQMRIVQLDPRFACREREETTARYREFGSAESSHRSRQRRVTTVPGVEVEQMI